MKRIDLKKVDLDSAAAEIAEILTVEGAVVLIPTETVYGLIARAGDKKAEERIFELKHREKAKPLGWFIGDWRKLPEYGVKLEGMPEKLAAEYCPGALTIIAPADNSSIGFRVPDYPLLTRLLAVTGVPLVQTSANASGMPNVRSCDEALAQLCGEVDCAVDGGIFEGELMGSTVVDATGKQIKILRQGSVDLHKWL